MDKLLLDRRLQRPHAQRSECKWAIQAEVMRSNSLVGSASVFKRSEIEQSIPDRFAKIAMEFPERLAVGSHGLRLTYRELDLASNRVAQRILALRGDTEEPVALLMDQGSELVTAILGALKAGKIYLALDPRHPRSELLRILGHSAPELMVCDQPNHDLALKLVGRPERLLNSAEIGADAPGTAPQISLYPDRRAYIFYTSGSTGEPKGVVDCHRNVLHNVMRYTNNLKIDANDRLSLIQSCTFSGTVSSLFGALLNGAAIFPFDLQGEGIDAMATWLTDERITIFHSVPVIFEQFTSLGVTLPQLRLIRLEGDRSEPRHVQRFKENCGPNCVLVNGLGATETGIVRQFFIDQESATPETVVPIGYPVEDMEVRLLDDEGDEVATGEIGEIAIASRYLALGYWKRPDLTEQAFQADPADPMRRIYRTRDLGRMLPDGCLEYLGRKDFQAKVRGMRIDTAEIEATLNRQPGVEQSVVMAREDRPGIQQLVAYVTTSHGQAISVSGLRHALAMTLPELMIPARYVVLDQFPLDPNRKLDRRALPPPGRLRPDLDTVYFAPVTERQKLIADCFGEALGLDAVGLNDDFFELGGDSLLATELLLLVDQRLGVLCPPEFLFFSPSIAGMDQSFENEVRAGGLIPLQPAGQRLPLFCLSGHSGYVFEYRHLARLLGPDRPVYGVQSGSATVRSGQPPLRVEDMATAALAEILRVQPQGPYHLCGNCLGGVVAFEVAQQLRARGHRVQYLALIDSAFPSGTSTIVPPRAIGDYWDEIVKLSFPRKAAYIAARLRNYFARLGRVARRNMKVGMVRLADALGVSRPRMEDSEARFNARTRYRPKSYDGPITLFTPDRPDGSSRWQDMVAALRVVQISGDFDASRRPHLVSEPYVHDLARAMQAQLGDDAG